MKASEILAKKEKKEIYSIRPNATLTEAVKIQCDNKIGALMVLDDKGNPVGIITERDILQTVNQKLDQISNLKVSDAMTRELICALPDDELNYIMNVLTVNKIRHLPIVANKKLIGLISIGDVINSQLEKTRVENHLLQDYLHLTGQI